MPKAILASDPTSIIVRDGDVLYHRQPLVADRRIGGGSDLFSDSAVAKWGLRRIVGSPEVGGGFPILVPTDDGRFAVRKIVRFAKT